MEPILAIAARHGIPVVEDACQAHARSTREGGPDRSGSRLLQLLPRQEPRRVRRGRRSSPVRADLLRKIQAFRDHGQTRKYHHSVVGWNARMMASRAPFLALKLKHLARNNEHVARMPSL